jgi:hypothetical protein
MRINGQNFKVKYKVSQGPVSHTADAFLAAGLFPAMKMGRHLSIKGTVSEKLLTATGTIQDIVKAWFPGYTSISIDAESSNHTELNDQRGVGALFSGGMDAFYTLLKHRKEITTLIFMHGFDVPLDNHIFRDRVSRSIREVAIEFDKALIEVEINLPECLRNICSRFRFSIGADAHGAVLASIAHLLSPQLKKVYIPSSYPYSNLNPWGSSPLLDPLWSTEDVEIVHAGCEANRVEKAALIAQSEIALKHLRVCFSEPEDAINCGRCEKCLRVMATLRTVGALDRCNAFSRNLDLDAFARVDTRDDAHYKGYQLILQTVEINGSDPELAKALHKIVKNYEYNKLAKELNEEMGSFFESSTGNSMLGNRRNTFFKYFWRANPGWMSKEVFKENLKLADQKIFGGLIYKYKKMHRNTQG